MIGYEEAILQDQLFQAIDGNGAPIPGKVCIRYPRGSGTILAVFFTNDPPTLVPVPADQISGFTIFSVMETGNLLNTPDRGNCPGTIILGADLTPL